MAKLPKLTSKLGPIKSLGIRFATRAANSLRAGYGVEHYRDLDGCGLIAVSSSPDLLPSILDQLAHSEIDWRGKTLLVLDSSIDSQDLGAFRLRHASVATLEMLEGYDDSRFIVQAEPRTVKQLRNLFEDGRIRLLSILPGNKALYLAGLTIATSLATPLLTASVECLTTAGLDYAQAQAITDATLTKTQRAHMKAGRRGWSGPLANKDMKAIRTQWEGLRRTNPVLADYFIESATLALEYFRQDPRWVTELSELPRRHTGKVLKILANVSAAR